MFDFLTGSDVAISSVWDIVGSGTTPTLYPADFLSNWERTTSVTAPVELQPSVAPVSHFNQPPGGSCFSLTNAEYEKIVADLADCDPSGALSEFRFPSKHAVVRFVKAFFKHMAPQFPVLHQPTFQIAAAPCE